MKTRILLVALGALAVPSIAFGQGAGAAFAAADKNGDGSLSKAEFPTFIDQLAAQGNAQAKRVTSMGAYGRAFSRIDGDGNGKVTKAELAAMQ
jgi:Ca2+-binding EF-hand superfamily protein